MELKDDVILAGLDIRMRVVLTRAEQVWRKFGRVEGVTVTSALDGKHSAGSLHYYGLALDFRTHYWDYNTQLLVFDKLKKELPDKLFNVIFHKTHIHVQYNLEN